MEDLQKNWRSLLAPGADVASNTEPLVLSDAELSVVPWELTKHNFHRGNASGLSMRRRMRACAPSTLKTTAIQTWGK